MTAAHSKNANSVNQHAGRIASSVSFRSVALVNNALPDGERASSKCEEAILVPSVRIQRSVRFSRPNDRYLCFSDNIPMLKIDNIAEPMWQKTNFVLFRNVRLKGYLLQIIQITFRPNFRTDTSAGAALTDKNEGWFRGNTFLRVDLR